MLNGFLEVLTYICSIYKSNNELVLLNNPVKISLLSGIMTLSMILGNSLNIKILRKYSIFHINVWSDVMILLIGIGFNLSSIG